MEPVRRLFGSPGSRRHSAYSHLANSSSQTNLHDGFRFTGLMGRMLTRNRPLGAPNSTTEETARNATELTAQHLTEPPIPSSENPINEAEQIGTSNLREPHETQMILALIKLQESIDALTTEIKVKFTKDPLEKLLKERDDLSKLVLVIAGLSSASLFFSPPGGVDSSGYVRFRQHWLFQLFHPVAGITFLVSFINLALLHKPLRESTSEQAMLGLRRRMKVSTYLLWVAIIAFFATFVLGFWLVYPAEEPADPVILDHYPAWPRWFILALAILKVVISLGIVYDGRP